jgi:hypothetical protein
MISIPSNETQSRPSSAHAGNLIGFVDSRDCCQEIIKALGDTGIGVDRIITLTGAAGLQVFRGMLGGYSWGEESEKMLRVGEAELTNGHIVICVQAIGRDEGMKIAQTALYKGGHGFRHFGALTDERLTA